MRAAYNRDGSDMMLELKPPDQVGPVAVGMTVEEAEAALRGLPGFVSPGRSLVGRRGIGRYVSGLAIRTHAGTQDRVEAIEVFPPDRVDIVTFEGIDVFGTPATELLERLGTRHELVEEMEESLFVAPSLLLALWRHDSASKYFGSALVARPGYYDGPPAHALPAGQDEEPDRLLWRQGWRGGLGRRRGGSR